MSRDRICKLTHLKLHRRLASGEGTSVCHAVCVSAALVSAAKVTCCNQCSLSLQPLLHPLTIEHSSFTEMQRSTTNFIRMIDNPYILMFTQTGCGRVIRDRGWSTKWRALSTWNFVCSAWPTARCHRSVTRTTTVLLTRRASSTHMTLNTL